MGTPAGPGKHICGFSMGSVSLHGNEKYWSLHLQNKALSGSYLEIVILLFKVHVLVRFGFSQFGEIGVSCW